MAAVNFGSLAIALVGHITRLVYQLSCSSVPDTRLTLAACLVWLWYTRNSGSHTKPPPPPPPPEFVVFALQQLLGTGHLAVTHQ